MTKKCMECGAEVSRLRRERCRVCYLRLLAELKERGEHQARAMVAPDQRALSKTEPGPGGCLLFTGTLDKDGYGRVGEQGYGMRMAHRVVYEAQVGPIPADMELDHLCRVRRCVNVAHLELVTRRENSLRSESFAAKNARKTHCIRGHEFSPENTYVKPNGHRQCRQCGRDASVRYFAGMGRARDRRARQRKQGDQP
ncbi:HNH endonuclease signature motif containing protein [Streptomyces sp. NPDC056817]|uniref:HNH endonuclease signature motif containing protein n=1 Tax=Streptomyces sp. NPDC056817 TaxID=3345950 RepID=UPI003684556F